MWFLCQDPCKTLDQARKRALRIIFSENSICGSLVEID